MKTLIRSPQGLPFLVASVFHPRSLARNGWALEGPGCKMLMLVGIDPEKDRRKREVSSEISSSLEVL